MRNNSIASALLQKKPLFKRLAVVLGAVALLVAGGKMYIAHAEQAALEKQREEAEYLLQRWGVCHIRGG